MDPVSAFGLISGALQVGQIITETLAGLASLREKYQHADLTIGALEQQVRTIRAAITQLEDWTRVRLRESPAEYKSSLEVSLEGCQIVMDALAEEVRALTQGTSANDNGIGFRLRMRVVWREDVMRGHQERLQSQVIALQLLVQACQWYVPLITYCTFLVRRRELTRDVMGSANLLQRKLNSSVKQKTGASYGKLPMTLRRFAPRPGMQALEPEPLPA